MKKTVYLAGAMSAKRNLGATWRKNIREFLTKRKWTVYDPCVEESKYIDIISKKGHTSIRELKIADRKGYADLMKLIERNDLKLVDKSQIVVVLVDHALFKSDGTILEIAYAVKKNKQIYALMKMPWIKVPGWTFRRLVNNCRIFYNWDDLKAYITKEGK